MPDGCRCTRHNIHFDRHRKPTSHELLAVIYTGRASEQRGHRSPVPEYIDEDKTSESLWRSICGSIQRPNQKVVVAIIGAMLIRQKPPTFCSSRLKAATLSVLGHHGRIGPVRFAEKTSRNTVPTNLLWEKNIVPAEKTSWKKWIIRETNRARVWF